MCMAGRARSKRRNASRAVLACVHHARSASRRRRAFTRIVREYLYKVTSRAAYMVGLQQLVFQGDLAMSKMNAYFSW